MSGGASSQGPAIDKDQNPVTDPSENVRLLSEAANKRQDDLRGWIEKYLDSKIESIEKTAELRAKHLESIIELQMERLEKIRQVDVLNASTAADRAGEAIKTLATQTATIAETGRAMVATTATNLETRLSGLFGESNKRLSALELTASEGRGKQAFADPQLMEMLTEIKRLRETTSEARGVDPFIRAGLEDMHKEIAKLNHFAANDGGKSQGMVLMWAGVVAVIGIVIGLAGWLAP